MRSECNYKGWFKILPIHSYPTVWILLRSGIVIILIAFSGLHDACAEAQLTKATKDSALKLEVIFDKDAYKKNDPVIISFKMTNKGNKPIWVNTRCYLANEEVKKRDVTLELLSPSGNRLVSNYSFRTGYPRTEIFAELQPGEDFTSDNRRHLAGYFKIHEIGQYTAVAIYENQFGGEIGIDAYKKRVVSEPATFTITE